MIFGDPNPFTHATPLEMAPTAKLLLRCFRPRCRPRGFRFGAAGPSGVQLKVSSVSSKPKDFLVQNQDWLVVSTPLKNISQNGNLPQIGVKIKNIWNHHPEEVDDF